MTNETKAMLRREYSKEWQTLRMIDYCTNKAAEAAVMEDGTVVVVEKQSLKKQFCFGESGYDMDDAMDMCRLAETNEDYFTNENMKELATWLEDLREVKEGSSRYFAVIYRSPNSRIGYLNFRRDWAVLEDLGGSAVVDELPGKIVKALGENTEYRIATEEDIDRLIAAYDAAAEAHYKRIQTYLKRYGLSKVRTWTYWRDR